MHAIDWTIVTTVMVLLIAVVLGTNRLNRSVADFLAAGRSAGRYVICVSDGIAALGAISLMGLFEMHYQAGFSAVWWNLMMAPVIAIVNLSGWIVYRYRETRALTLGQFFEARYSKRFRVFAGIVCFLSGIINFGIFPSVGARFFIYFCGIPQYIHVLGIDVSTYFLTMLLLLATALYFTFVGGQIAVIVTDFVQGVFCNIVFLLIMVLVLYSFSWSQITTALMTAPADASLLQPFHTGSAKDFNAWFFLIGAVGYFYTYLSWQGTQGYNASARNPHEARMAKVLSTWRLLIQNLLVVMLPIAAYTVMHHSDFSGIAHNVSSVIAGIHNPQIQDQMVVPVALSHFLPPGFTGAFCAVMLAAFITTHDTYLHSWGSIFIQDVVMPFRSKPFTPKQHLRVLRFSILGVAVFVFLFSLLFKQTEYIYMFFAITGAIFTGGAGAVIIGGLYWKRGTTMAAWWAMIIGSTLAVTGIIIRQIDPEFFLNGQVMWFISMAASSCTYVAVSLVGRRKDFNMDRLLHRGEYAIEDDRRAPVRQPAKSFSEWLGIGAEFTRADKAVYFATIAWTAVWIVIFVAGTAYNVFVDVPVQTWATFWGGYVGVSLVVCVVVTLWLTAGGIYDLREFYRTLRTRTRDDSDNGTVAVWGNRDAAIPVEADPPEAVSGVSGARHESSTVD